jgi:2-polyprenyl-6-methoxyphenol hydroxylase-like FAD-dependent oxidoreductase
MEPRALIIGAGIGGLAAGIALRRRGWEVCIHERASNPRELGFGLLLAPNALAALRELDVADPVTRSGAAAGAVEVRRLNGQVIRRFDAQLGGPSVVALRRDLHSALLNAIGEETLNLGSEVLRVTHDAAGVKLRLIDGRLDAGAVLIGADGVNSTIRKQLHPDEAPPRPSGFCAIRGVAYGVSSRLGNLSAIAYMDDGIEAAAARASSDAVYWYISLLARDVGSASDPPEILGRWYPTFDPTFRAIVETTTPEELRFDNLLKRDPLQAWGEGRITLLGDAAHPLLPHTGQGAAQALEDAVALGLALSPSGKIEEALRRYERVRMQRTCRFVKLGPRIARVTTTRNPLIQSARTLAFRLLPESLLTKWASKQRDPHRTLRSA